MLRLALMTNVTDFSFLKLLSDILLKVKLFDHGRLSFELRCVWKTANEFVLEDGFAQTHIKLLLVYEVIRPGSVIQPGCKKGVSRHDRLNLHLVHLVLHAKVLVVLMDVFLVSRT